MTVLAGSDRIQVVLRALQDPFRRKLLRHMDGLKRPMAPVDYVKEVGVERDAQNRTIGKVSYHLRQLENAGLVDLVDTQLVRGATKHFYRISKDFPPEDRDMFPPEYRDTLALDEIATLFQSEAAEKSEGLLQRINEIIRSTGRICAEVDLAA